MNMVRKLVREPLARFLLIGVVVFAAYSALDDRPATAPTDEIVVSQATVERLVAGFEATWRRPPSSDELARLVDDRVREEVYVRAALALGLDRDDAVIRRRLRQKMEFFAGSAAEELTPSEDELNERLASRPDLYATPAAVALEQVYLGKAPSEAEVAAARKALDGGADPATVGVRSMLPARLPPTTRRTVDGVFGAGFFDALADAPMGAWAGPVRSGFGLHLVRVEARLPATVPPLDEVRGAVERDWKREAGERMREAQYQALRSRYTVVSPDLSTTEVAR